MQSDDKLTAIFDRLRAEPATTSIAEVAGWVNNAKPTFKIKNYQTSFSSYNVIAMSTILTATLIGTILMLSEKKGENLPSAAPSKITKTTTSQVKDSTRKEAIPAKPENLPLSTLDIIQVPQIAYPGTENQNHFFQLPLQLEIIDPAGNTLLTPRPTGNTSSTWNEDSGMLHIDTLFKGVNKVVFRGNFNDEIRIEGSKREDVSFQFRHEKKTKGLIKNDGSRYEVSYEIVDSVLTIRSLSSGTDWVIVGYISVKDSVKLIIPEHLPIDIQTDYGDISVSSLKGSSIQLNTSYGDLSVNNCSGAMRLKSDYGDFELTELIGEIDANTNYGDVRGERITAKEHCILSTDFGNVDLQLLNPIQECTLNLKTDFGRIKSKRRDFSIEGNQFNFGTGSQKIILKTDMGDVILR